MDIRQDLVEKAMKSLKARTCGRAKCDNILEERIMQELGNLQRIRSRTTRWLVAGLAIIVCGAGFGSAGGMEMVKQWFTRVEFVDQTGDPATLRVTDSMGQVIGDIHVEGGGPEGPENTNSDGP